MHLRVTPSKLHILITLIFGVACFYGGLYVGSGQGVLYALGLEATSARDRANAYDRGELYDGEFLESAEATIDSNISFFGTHLQRYWLLHQIPSPWSLSDAGESFMKEAVEYRLEHPRPNEEKMRSLLDPNRADENLSAYVNAIRDENGDLPFTEEETVEFVKDLLKQLKKQEEAYQHALDYVRKQKRGDA